MFNPIHARIRSIVLAPLALALMLALPSTATATTVVKVSLETMVAASDLIVHGTVAVSRAETVNSNARHIRTVVEIDVSQVLKGALPTGQNDSKLRLLFPGGRVGKWAIHTPGRPAFKPGEEVVLYLEKTSMSYAIVGMSQGKFSVVAPSEGPKLVRRTLDGLHFVAPDARGKLVESRAPTYQQQTLDALLEKTRHFVKKSGPSSDVKTAK